jgi:hypothetical protein
VVGARFASLVPSVTWSRTSTSEQMHTILQRVQPILDALNTEKTTY